MSESNSHSLQSGEFSIAHHFPTQAAENWSLPALRSCKPLDLPEQSTDKSPQYIICILSRDFNPHWFKFLQTFECPANYNICMVIDKNPEKQDIVDTAIQCCSMNDTPSSNTEESRDLPERSDGDTLNYKKKINIIQVSDRVCIKSKYYKSSSCTNLKDIVAWDKALCFFNHISLYYRNSLESIFPIESNEGFHRSEAEVNPHLPQHSKVNGKMYDYIWFFEDDVFFHNLNTILNIDAKYPSSDLLSAFHEKNESGNIYNGWNHWCNVVNRIPTPWAHSLISACRMSFRLMQKVDNYVKNNSSLMFIEALFSTLALHNNYIVDNPIEMASTITYDKKWNIDDITDESKIYHPLKKTEDHEMYRKKMV
jgi:hypothetical protein